MNTGVEKKRYILLNGEYRHLVYKEAFFGVCF